jgi:drug/metabolite transporter (DMT)-like permease
MKLFCGVIDLKIYHQICTLFFRYNSFMKQRSLALIAVSIATLIYGITYTIAKEVMPVYVKPFGFILIRIIGATAIFWILSLFIKYQKIDKSDYKKILIASFFGVGLNMLTFFKGLSLTTPISASVMMVTSPIMVLIFSSILIKKAIGKQRILGIIIGLVGAIVLITYGSNHDIETTNSNWGNFLVFINAASYGLYLVISKNLIEKYHPITLVKWLYLFGLFFTIPFGYHELREVTWQEIPTTIYWSIGFVVIFTSCVTYLFNLYGLSKLKPTTVSVFIYLQPVIATIYALIVGSDSLHFVKIVATLLIFSGVYLVTKQIDSSVK